MQLLALILWFLEQAFERTEQVYLVIHLHPQVNYCIRVSTGCLYLNNGVRLSKGLRKHICYLSQLTFFGPLVQTIFTTYVDFCFTKLQCIYVISELTFVTLWLETLITLFGPGITKLWQSTRPPKVDSQVWTSPFHTLKKIMRRAFWNERVLIRTGAMKTTFVLLA